MSDANHCCHYSERRGFMSSAFIKNFNAIQSEFFYDNLDSVFSRLLELLDCSCGILVLKESSDSFLEVASWGYLEDYYYSFLARGNGNFESISASDIPVIFPANKFNLYKKDSLEGIGFRIDCNNEILGFIFAESSQKFSDLKKEFLQLVCEKIAQLHATKLNPVNNELKENEISNELFDYLLNNSVGFANSLKANRFINIQGGRGTGKKSLVKYIYTKLGLHGKLIYLNSLSDVAIKIEKSIQDWIQLAENGIIVIENVSSLSVTQQKVFFDFLKEPILEPRIIFLDDLTKHKEEYLPFWTLLAQHTIRLPDLLTLDKEKFKEIVDKLFYSLRQLNHRMNMTLTEDVYEYLFNYPYKENLRDLRNLLEKPILNSKENIITKEFYLKLNNSEIKSLDFYKEEDLDLRKCVQALERQKILLANKLFSGNQIRMAKALGVSRGSLQYKMKQLEL